MAMSRFSWSLFSVGRDSQLKQPKQECINVNQVEFSNTQFNDSKNI